MQFSLRTLLVVMLLAPPVLAEPVLQQITVPDKESYRHLVVIEQMMVLIAVVAIATLILRLAFRPPQSPPRKSRK